MKRAFTIIELIFVIVVLGILATVALPKFQESYKESLVSKAQAKVTAVRSGLQVYKNRHIVRGESPFPDKLDSDANHLFDRVLPDPVIPGDEAGDWKRINQTRYKYLLPDGYIVFDYNSTAGTFLCNENLSTSRELCNAF